MIAACGNHINSKKSQIAVADPTAIQKKQKRETEVSLRLITFVLQI